MGIFAYPPEKVYSSSDGQGWAEVRPCSGRHGPTQHSCYRVRNTWPMIFIPREQKCLERSWLPVAQR